MRSRLTSGATALAGFGLLTLAVFRPTASELAHTTPVVHGGAADALLYMWATSHVSQALFTDPLHLFDAGIFYPCRYTLAGSDHMIGQALLGLPVWLATRNPLLEYNLLVLGSYALAATGMFLFAAEQLGSRAGALAAALAFAFTPFRFRSPLWPQVLFTGFMPLALLFWLRFVRRLRWSDWALWVGCWTVHSLMGMYLTVYFAVTMGALAVLALVAGPTRRSPRLWAGTLGAPVAALLLLAPTLWPYVYLRLYQSHVRESGVGTPLSFFLPGPGTLSGHLTGLEGPDRFGPGLVVVGLALLGVVLALGARRGVPDWRRFARAANAVGLVLTLALVLLPIGVWIALPAFDMLRNTYRAFFVSLLFVGLFVGEAVAWLVGRAGSRRAAALVAVSLVAVLLADVGTPASERRRLPVGDEIPPVYRWLERLGPDEVVYEGVVGIEAPAMAMYYAIFHEKRLATGYSGFVSPGAAYMTHRLRGFPDEPALRLLDALGIRHVVWHFPAPAAAERFVGALPAGVEVAARFGTDVVFAVSTAGAAAPADAALRSLPRAGWEVRASDGARPGERRADTAWQVEVAPGGPAPWLRLDLGAPHLLGAVRCRTARPQDRGVFMADVELSLDGERWERLGARFAPDSLATLIERPAAVGYWEARFPLQRARYVRLVNPELAFWGGRWELSDVEVLGGAE